MSVGMDGLSTTISRALCHAHGVPQAGIRNMGAESAVVRRYRDLCFKPQEDLEKEVGLKVQHFGQDFLRFGRQVALEAGEVGRSAEGRLLLHAYFRGLTGGRSLLSVSSILRKAKAGRGESEGFETRFLEAIEAEASFAFAQINEIRHLLRRWKELGRKSRQDSRVGEAAALIVSGVAMSASELGREMRLDPAAARRHLQRLEDAGVVREITGRRGWRVYMASDVGGDLSAQTGARGRSALSTVSPARDKEPIELNEFDAELGDAMKDAEDAIRRIEKRLMK